MHTTEWDRHLLAETLRQIMQATDLTQADVGAMAGRARTMVSRWLSGEHRPEFGAARTFVTALTQQHPEMAQLATQFMAAAGYHDSQSPESPNESETGPMVVRQLRAIAAVEGKTIGEILVENGVQVDELAIPDRADPIIAEIEADEYLRPQQKERLIALYIERRGEIFEAERRKRARERRRPSA